MPHPMSSEEPGAKWMESALGRRRSEVGDRPAVRGPDALETGGRRESPRLEASVLPPMEAFFSGVLIDPEVELGVPEGPAPRPDD